MRIEPQEYVRRIETAHPCIKVVGIPTGSWRKVALRCTKCGANWSACPANLTTSAGEPKFGCPGCRYVKVSEKVLKPSSFYVDRIRKAHPDLRILDEPTSALQKIRLECERCSFVWSQAVAHLTTSDGRPKTGCPNCKKSHGETAVAAFLNSAGFHFEQQKRFESCYNKRPLPFDFYIPDCRVLIEFQGEQHYKPSRRRNGVEKFEQTQKNDQIKKDWVRSNGLTLIEIKQSQNVGDVLAAFPWGQR